MPERVRLLATYGAARLARMLIGVFERLRSAGRPLELRAGEGVKLAERLAELQDIADRDALPDRGSLGGPRARRARPRAPVPAAARGEPPRSHPSCACTVSAPSGSPRTARRSRRSRAPRWTRSRPATGVSSRTLLVGFDRAYAEAKSRESALDFEDLQLVARDLLRAPRGRSRADELAVPVDHGGRVPGHEPAPVRARRPARRRRALLRRRRVPVDLPLPPRGRGGLPRAAGGERSASSRSRSNYRSRPEVLGVVNHLFGTEFGTDFEPLVAAGRFPEPLFGPGVELLVTDKSTYREGQTHWRIAEARHVARRVRELVDAGEATPGEIVLLFTAGTDAERYEEALREEGLPTHRAAGRGYFGQQQVVDLVSYLRLLHNRYDDEALVTVLASPFVGRLERRARPAAARGGPRGRSSPASSASCRPSSARRDRRLFDAFRQRYDRLVKRLRAPRARAPLRGDHRRARLRPRRARPLGRAPPLCEPAEARAARALLRGPARARTSRASSASSATRRRRAPRRSRPSPRRRAQTRCGC